MSLTLFAGSANLPLAEAIVGNLGLRLGSMLLQHFPDGEFHIEIQETVRGHDVYLIQPTGPKDVSAVADAADAAKLAHKVARLEPLICING
jgi:phosphoribosylpyrophosphate synthetase